MTYFRYFFSTCKTENRAEATAFVTAESISNPSGMQSMVSIKEFKNSPTEFEKNFTDSEEPI